MSARQPSAVVEKVLAESGLAHDDALRSALEGIRALRPASAPAPTGELAALLADASTLVPAIPLERPAAVVQPLRPRTVKRHRGAMISAMVVAGMGLGVTGVAALGGDPLSWIVPGLPAAVSEAPAPAEATPSPAVEPLEAVPGAGGAADDGVSPPWLPGASASSAAKGAQSSKAAAAKAAAAKANGQQGLLGGAAASGHKVAQDAAGGPLAAAEHAVSGAVGGAVSGAEATDDGVSAPGLEASVGVEAGASGGVHASGKIGSDPHAALDEGAAAADDSVSALLELARVSRGEVPGSKAQGKGSGR